jgi:hypothetical protein
MAHRINFLNYILEILSSYELRYWAIYMAIITILYITDIVSDSAVYVAIGSYFIGGYLTGKRILREERNDRTG